MPEHETPELKAVHVACNQDGDEYYSVGYAGVTDIKWSRTEGHMGWLRTVCVYINGELSSEHPFTNCLGVHYVRPEALAKEAETWPGQADVEN